MAYERGFEGAEIRMRLGASASMLDDGKTERLALADLRALVPRAPSSARAFNDRNNGFVKRLSGRANERKKARS